LLVVEVAVSSHHVDCRAKAHLYARAGVPTYWLVDVPAQTVEVRTGPGAGGYRHQQVYRLGASVPSPIPSAADLDVTELLAGLGD
jgi:Uma2 family endonuclease